MEPRARFPTVFLIDEPSLLAKSEELHDYLQLVASLPAEAQEDRNQTVEAVKAELTRRGDAISD